MWIGFAEASVFVVFRMPPRHRLPQQLRRQETRKSGRRKVDFVDMRPMTAQTQHNHPRLFRLEHPKSQTIRPKMDGCC
jgi:hypothetical protein